MQSTKTEHPASPARQRLRSGLLLVMPLLACGDTCCKPMEINGSTSLRGLPVYEIGSCAAPEEDPGCGEAKAGRADHSAVRLRDGRVLVIGGFGCDGPRATTQTWDPATGRWNINANTPGMIIGYTATLLDDGRALVTGGKDRAGFSQTWTRTFHPGWDDWVAQAPLPAWQSWHTATALASGLVLVTGVTTDEATVEVSPWAALYDPVADAWRPTSAPALPRFHASATLLSNGMVLVAGGEAPFGATARAERYDPVAQSWREASSMAQPRTSHEAFLLPSGGVLVTGEPFGEPWEIYQPAPESWGVAPGSPLDGRAALLQDGTLLIVAEVSLRYDPATGHHWPVATGEARQGSTLTTLQDGRLLLVGGVRWVQFQGESSPRAVHVASAEIYDPATDTWTRTGDLLPDP